MYGRLFNLEDIDENMRHFFEVVEVECGAPYERLTEQVGTIQDRWSAKDKHAATSRTRTERTTRRLMQTSGWKPTCTHEAPVVPATVLDPFMGSGTTALAAKKLGRRAVGIELDERCERLIQNRLGQESLLFGEVAV